MIFYYKGDWLEDRLPVDLASVHFRFGAGFFETILHNGQRLMHLDRHLERLYESLETFTFAYEKLELEAVIGEVLGRNGLTRRMARVNVFYLIPEPFPAPPEPGEDKARALVTAWPHDLEPNKTLELTIFAKTHISHLSAHKAMNYMHQYLALRDARQRGFDEAALTDGARIMEAATAGLVFGDSEGLYTPGGAYLLPSTALSVAREVLDIGQADVHADNLEAYRYVYALNALNGMRPVTRIDSMRFEPDWLSCRRANEAILGIDYA